MRADTNTSSCSGEPLVAALTLFRGTLMTHIKTITDIKRFLDDLQDLFWNGESHEYVLVELSKFLMCKRYADREQVPLDLGNYRAIWDQIRALSQRPAHLRRHRAPGRPHPTRVGVPQQVRHPGQ